jgi:hypothetical protein
VGEWFRRPKLRTRFLRAGRGAVPPPPSGDVPGVKTSLRRAMNGQRQAIRPHLQGHRGRLAVRRMNKHIAFLRNMDALLGIFRMSYI